MFKKIIAALFATCCCNFLLADSIPVQKRLLYYVDSEKPTQFLVPYVETTLRDMRNTSNSDLLKSVTSLNILMESKSMGRMLTNIYKFLEEDAKLNIVDLQKQDREFAKALTESDLFLKISIKDFNGLLGYDFILYNVNPNDKNKNLAPTLEYMIGSSTFIDPRSNDYKSDLIFAIKQLFPESNQKPALDIFTDKRKINGIIYLNPGDTIEFGLRVTDADSPPERFVYGWGLEAGTTGNSSAITSCSRNDQSNFKIVVNETGNYFIGARAFDGVDTSNVSMCEIRCIKQASIREFYTTTGGPVRLYHYTYFLFDYNHYQTEDRVVLSFDVDSSIRTITRFKLYPLSGANEKLSTGYVESGSTRQDSLFDDVVINRDTIMIDTTYGFITKGVSVKSVYSFYLHRQKHRGNYALQAEVEQNNKTTTSEIIPVQFYRVWPIELGIDYTFNWISPAGLFKHSNFISYASVCINAHLFRAVNAGFGADIASVHGNDAALSSYRFLRNTNYYFSGNWRRDIHWNRISAWGVGLNIGKYQFPGLGNRNPGIEVFGLMCVESAKKYQVFLKPGYTLIRENEQTWYQGLSIGFRFVYQPSRHDPLENYK